MKKALLVIDMQNDYLYEKRKPRFAYRTEELTAAVNALIRQYHEEGSDVIYIRHIIQNLPTNRLLLAIRSPEQRARRSIPASRSFRSTASTSCSAMR